MDLSRASCITVFGDKRFSPVMEIITYLTKQICDSPGKTGANSPYFFCFPDKCYSSVWLSVGLLTNFFFEDYIQNDNDPGIDPVPGSNYEIYGNISRFIRFDNSGRLVFEFAEGAQAEAPSKLKKFLKNTKRQRLSQLRDYKANRQQVIKNRSAISRILEPIEGIRVNDQTLKSKVLLITGRNNTNKFREYIQNTNVCGESLSQIFTRNENLLLKENLSALSGLFDGDYEVKVLKFIELFNTFLGTVTKPDLCARLNELSESLKNNLITEDFDRQFCKIVFDFGGGLQYLKDNLYPGPKSHLLDNIKAVILNDIYQIELYANTIADFIKEGIPVFVISDRIIDFQGNPSFYENLFQRNDACRINWNKLKIKELEKIEDSDNNYVDAEFWTRCKRFALQKIKIEIFEGCSLDQLMHELRREIKKYPDYQRLKEAYYNFLETAYTLIKNSDQNNTHCKYLTLHFRKVLEEVRPIINQDLLNLLDKALDQIDNFESNTKVISESDNNFAVSFNVEGTDISIPGFADKNNLPDYDSEQLVFTGFPYNEPLRYFLHDAVCRFLVPEITIKTWPIESELTIRYITRRLRSGYFTDKICADFSFTSICLLSNKEDIESEIEKTVVIDDRQNINMVGDIPDQKPPEENDPEADLVIAASARFSSSRVGAITSMVNPVKCHPVIFEDDSYMFMPVATSEAAKAKAIIGRFDKNSSRFIVERIDEGQMEAGQYFFDIDFSVDLPTVFRLSGINQTDAETLTSNLYVWRRLLQELFEKHEHSLENLASFLEGIKNDNLDTLAESNPAIYNLRNWLYNTDILAPDLANIQLICKAAGCSDSAIPKEIIEIRSNIAGKLISLSRIVRNDIERKFSGKKTILDSYFAYEKNNVKIKCKIKRIASIVRDVLTVEYSVTRKVIKL